MKFLDLGLKEPALRAALDVAYRRVMDSGWVVLGPEVEAFEAEFAAYCNVQYCVGVGNGLDALTLCLRAAGIGAGDEVIVPSHTFAATWIAVAGVGATPRPVEVDPNTFTLDPGAVAAAITERTAAIIPVSLYGHPADMDPIMALAGQHNLFVLEDAAQAHGALYKGRKVGGLAHATAFSFYPTKNLGAVGDAGAVVTADHALSERLRMLRNYGAKIKYVHEESGVNSRLDELQAAFLRVQLRRLDRGNGDRRALAAQYRTALNESDLITPSAADWARHVYHLYAVRSLRRNEIRAHLGREGIETLVHYPVPCHLQPAFEPLGYKAGDFPVAEAIAGEVFSLPLRPGMDPKDVQAVSESIMAAYIQ